MKRARLSTSSLRLSIPLWIALLTLAAGSLLVLGTPPAWWAQRGAIDVTKTADDYAAANLGQLKHFASKAAGELNGKLPGGAGPVVNAMIAEWSTPPPAGVTRDDYAAVNLGQLKAVAQPFYDRLMEIEFTDRYPWSGAADDFALANLGQLKTVFSFDLTGFDSGPVDTDGDGMPDQWEIARGFNPAVASDASADADLDGWSNLKEFLEGTDPRNSDSDFDGIKDSEDAAPMNSAPYPLVLTVVVPDVENEVWNPDKRKVELRWGSETLPQEAASLTVQRADGAAADWQTIGTASPDDSTFSDEGLFSCLKYRYRIVVVWNDGKMNASEVAEYEVPLIRSIRSRLATAFLAFPGFLSGEFTGTVVPGKFLKEVIAATSPYATGDHKQRISADLMSYTGSDTWGKTRVVNWPTLHNWTYSDSVTWENEIGDGSASIHETLTAPAGGGFGDLQRTNWSGDDQGYEIIELDPAPAKLETEWAASMADGTWTGSSTSTSTYEDGTQFSTTVPYMSLPGDRFSLAMPPMLGERTLSEPASTKDVIDATLALLPDLGFRGDHSEWWYGWHSFDQTSFASGADLFLAGFQIWFNETVVFIDRGDYHVTCYAPALTPDRPPVIVIKDTFTPKDDTTTAIDESAQKEVSTRAVLVTPSTLELSSGLIALAATPAAPQGIRTVEIAPLLPVEVKFMKPDSWDDELPENQVVLSDEKTRVKIKIRMKFDSLAKVLAIPVFQKVKFKTNGTTPDGVELTLNAQNCTFAAHAADCELRIELTRDQLKTMGCLPADEHDSVLEKAWQDTGNPDDPSTHSNLSDGQAFESGLSIASRGRSTSKGDLNSTPPNSPLDASFFKAAGVEVITAEIGGSISPKRQVMNQADIFYYSGHGIHSNGRLLYGNAPELAKYWSSNDLEIAIFAGCSVLDINDYNNHFPGTDHTSSPGKGWAGLGLYLMLGYNYQAPLDDQNSAAIASTWTGRRVTAGNLDAWRIANDNINGRNACAISDFGTDYHYFKKTTFLGMTVNYSWISVPSSQW